MKLILPYFILIIVVLQLCLRKNSKKNTKNNEDFWEKESRANSVRKKDISNLDYIVIPDTLTIPAIEDSRILKEWKTIELLKDKKILNLTGYSNTDLKLQFGAPNLSLLIRYDSNFTALAKAVAKLGELLMQEGATEAAVRFLEFGIQIHTDISTNYTLLAKYYIDCSSPEKLSYLIEQAEQLHSLMKDSIIQKLTAMQP